ncbi:Similar to hypothetical protein [Tuber melanosporum Mel28]; acc. no. XP_002836511 [Pyronema omphalodes CBS 100304]|uniref:Uncharacterized protein n=1 Tax=Pyronema omphalodes (strain CBS 100304) TaxID=1076935 RepID=U4LCS3_PYROM|nr:Similar to hypothetical protein [Tuber melanosporum Mel28]; acc. no. XP_002836511 [Pyronema omphalodes CBS 100304]
MASQANNIANSISSMSGISGSTTPAQMEHADAISPPPGPNEKSARTHVNNATDTEDTERLNAGPVSNDVVSKRTPEMIQKQLKKTSMKLVSRFIIDLVLWASFILAVMYTEQLGSLSRMKKHLFNAVGVGLPLMLGLNYNSSFQAMAGIMRWKILASAKFTLKEADLILSLDSFLTVFKLGSLWWKQCVNKTGANRKAVYFGRALACITWVILTLGSQIGVGLLGLTYDFNSDGVDALLLEKGPITITNLTTFSLKDDINANEDQYRAHQYGDLSDQIVENKNIAAPTQDFDEQPLYGVNLTVYSVDGTRDWIYRFRDWSGESSNNVRQYAVATTRYVTVSTKCSIYTYKSYAELSNTSTLLNWTKIEQDNISVDSATFVNFDVDPQKSACGARCARIGGVSTDWGETQWNTTECDIHVSTVFNTGGNTYYDMDDKMARIAAGSIAMDGIPRKTTSVSTGDISLNVAQFARYNNRTSWGGDFLEREEVERRVGRFAIGSIAMLDFYGRSHNEPIEGKKVLVGVKLTAKRPQLWVVMGLLVGVHMALIPIVLWIGNTIPSTDGSHLSTALLLKPVILAAEAEIIELQNDNDGVTIPSRAKEYHQKIQYKTEYDASKGGDRFELRLFKEPGREPQT